MMVPPITEMSDDLFEAIYNRARQLSYLEETEHTFNFQGCIRFKKNNIGSILNLASITRMTNILNRVYFITNQYTNEHGYSYPIIKLALRERRQNQTRSAHTFDSSWNTILGWAIGSRWPRENTPNMVGNMSLDIILIMFHLLIKQE